MGDDSWSKRPKYISLRVIDQLVKRIEEHCKKYQLSGFHVELHGGEPLMAGKEAISYILSEVSGIECGTHFSFSIQTNGLLLDAAWVRLFREYDVNIGVSIDGPPESADKYRVDKKGQGTTERVLNKISEVQREIPGFKPGVLCVLSSDSKIPEIIDWFCENNFHSFDLLLPSGNYQTKPHGVDDTRVFAAKLVEGFRHWISYGDAAPQIRLFETIIEWYMGRSIVLDSQGGDLKQLCVVESDGSIGVNDVARMCGGDLANDKVTIFDSALDIHSEVYDIDELQSLSDECLGCKFRRTCGGGYLPHRFDGESFKNPTIYCATQYALNEEIESFMKINAPQFFQISSP